MTAAHLAPPVFSGAIAKPESPEITDVRFSVTTTPFDENYAPSEHSRITTNFANLARGEFRQQNLRNVLAMIDQRFNELAHWDNPGRNRYTVELEIVSIQLDFTAGEIDEHFPLIELLDVHLIDHHTGTRSHGIMGNNFSSYIRDFDFSVRLPAVRASAGASDVPEDFGDLHGALFQRFLRSAAFREHTDTQPVICISVSTSSTYRQSENTHPILGVEYVQDEHSLTDDYFNKMGLRVRYFMPPGSVAPLAFYFHGDLLNDYSPLQLIGTISTMETFQKIYRPEIYSAHRVAGSVYQPSLEQQDFTRTNVSYDRVERSQLALKQGAYTRDHVMQPYGAALTRWLSSTSASAIQSPSAPENDES